MYDGLPDRIPRQVWICSLEAIRYNLTLARSFDPHMAILVGYRIWPNSVVPLSLRVQVPKHKVSIPETIITVPNVEMNTPHLGTLDTSKGVVLADRCM